MAYELPHVENYEIGEAGSEAARRNQYWKNRNYKPGIGYAVSATELGGAPAPKKRAQVSPSADTAPTSTQPTQTTTTTTTETATVSQPPVKDPFKEALKLRQKADRDMGRTDMESQYDNWSGTVDSNYQNKVQDVARGQQGVWQRGYNVWRVAEDIRGGVGNPEQNKYRLREAAMGFGAAIAENYGLDLLSADPRGSGARSGFENGRINLYFKDKKTGQVREAHPSIDDIQKQLEGKGLIDPDAKRKDAEKSRIDGFAKRYADEFNQYYDKGQMTQAGWDNMRNKIVDSTTDPAYAKFLTVQYLEGLTNKLADEQEALREMSNAQARVEAARINAASRENVAKMRNGESAESGDTSSVPADPLGGSLDTSKKQAQQAQTLPVETPFDREAFINKKRGELASGLKRAAPAADPLATMSAVGTEGDYIDRAIGDSKTSRELADLRRRDANGTLTPGGRARLKELEGKSLSADEQESLRRLKGEPKQTPTEEVSETVVETEQTTAPNEEQATETAEPAVEGNASPDVTETATNEQPSPEPQSVQEEETEKSVTNADGSYTERSKEYLKQNGLEEDELPDGFAERWQNEGNEAVAKEVLKKQIRRQYIYGRGTAVTNEEAEKNLNRTLDEVLAEIEKKHWTQDGKQMIRRPRGIRGKTKAYRAVLEAILGYPEEHEYVDKIHYYFVSDDALKRAKERIEYIKAN